MPRGGKRPGAGRKKGAATRKTRQVADKAATDGEATPLEVMLDAMRHFHDKKQWAKAATIAAQAAPYLHPRLSAVQHQGGLRLIHDVADLTDDELTAIAGEGDGGPGA